MRTRQPLSERIEGRLASLDGRSELATRLIIEERRHLKVIPNAFGGRPVLKLMLAAMTRAAERWRAIRFTKFERRQIDAVRQELNTEYEAENTASRASQNRRPASEIPSSSRA